MRHAYALIAVLSLACSGSSAAPTTTGGGGTSSAGGAAGESGTGGGSGGTTSAGGSAGASGFDGLNGCKEADFVDGTADAFDRTIKFGVTGFTFDPRCLRIKAGQMVTFSGVFASHPLEPGSTPTMPDTGSAGNPIMATSSGSSQAFTFPTAGTYPYNCAVHFASGMTGVVRAE